MNGSHDTRYLEGPRGRGNWLTKIALALVGAVILISAFFFLTVALIAGAFLALGIAVRWWWFMRKVRAQARASEALEGQYTVVERSRAEAPQPVDRDR